MTILMSVSHNNIRRETNMKEFYQHLVTSNPKLKIKVNKIHHFIKVDIVEMYFLTEDEYENWCKGRTYIWGDRAYHSGYPLRNEEDYLELSEQVLKVQKEMGVN